MVIVRRALATTAALAVLLGVWWGSHRPIAVHPDETAVLRLAWSARPERVERCREQSADELARVPVHMRQPVVCEGTTASYRLEVRHEGRLLAAQVVRGGGLRHDRRLYVFREFPVPGGEALVDVRFERIDEPGSSLQTGRATGPAPHGQVPARLRFEERLRFAAGHATLVTFESDRRELVVKTGSTR